MLNPAAISFLLCINILTLFYQISMVHAENNGNVKVYGFVFEFGTNKPLQGARINVATSQTSAQTFLAETNA